MTNYNAFMFKHSKIYEREKITVNETIQGSSMIKY